MPEAERDLSGLPRSERRARRAGDARRSRRRRRRARDRCGRAPRASARRPQLVAQVDARRGDALLLLGRLVDAADVLRSSGARPGRLALAVALNGQLRDARALAEQHSGAADPCAEIALAWVAAESDEPIAARRHLTSAGRVPVTRSDPVPGVIRAVLDSRLAPCGGRCRSGTGRASGPRTRSRLAGRPGAARARRTGSGWPVARARPWPGTPPSSIPTVPEAYDCFGRCASRSGPTSTGRAPRPGRRWLTGSSGGCWSPRVG